MEFHPRDLTINAARKIVPLLMTEFKPKSVLDLGCNIGCWLAEFEKVGILDVMGVDGDNMIPELLISREKFLVFDLTSELSLKRTYDMVLCLEVAEHIVENQSEKLMRNICRHGDLVIFSAALPGQGGHKHLNEQPIKYWMERFTAFGYIASEEFRERIPKDVSEWYRNNLVVYTRNQEAGIIEDVVW